MHDAGLQQPVEDFSATYHYGLRHAFPGLDFGSAFLTV
jgi:hypothetical protein